MEVETLQQLIEWQPPRVSSIISGGVLLPETRLVLFGMPKSWKCVAPDTHVLLYGSGLVPISNVQPGKLIFTSSAKRYVVMSATTEVKDAIRVTTHRGFTIQCSPEHRFLLSSGLYKEAKDLTYDDCLLIAFNTQVFGQQAVTAPYILGLLTGDGSFATEGYIGFTNQRLDLCELVANVLPASSVKSRGSHYQVNINGYREEVAHLWGIDTQPILSHSKEIPLCILRAGRREQLLFIKGLFDTDGNYSQQKGIVSFDMSSIKLLQQLQLVLANLGIMTRIMPTKHKEYRDWKLYFGGSDADKFCSILAIPHKPYSPSSPHEIKKEAGKRYYSKGYWLYPDKVSSVEPITGGLFYDLDIESPYNYIASGIVTHNSMIAIHTAFCLASGKDWFGFKTATTLTPYLFQVEIPKGPFRTRVMKYAEGANLYPPSIFFRTEHYLKLDTSYGVSAMERDLTYVVSRSGGNHIVLILDPLYKLMSGHITDAYDVQKLLDNIDIIRDKFHCSIILITHTRKPVVTSEGVIDRGAEEIMGSSFLANWCDTAVHTRLLNPFSGANKTELKFELVRHAETLLTGFQLEWNRANLQPKLLRTLHTAEDTLEDADDISVR